MTAPDRATSDKPNDPIDLVFPLLQNWEERASDNESSACQTRRGIIFGMAAFITGGATILAHFQLDGLALIFAGAMAFVAAFLNLVFERETTAWRQTTKMLAIVQCNIITEAGKGQRYVDLRTEIEKEGEIRGGHLPKTLTLYAVADAMRDRFGMLRMDSGSWLLYMLIVAAAGLAIYLKPKLNSEFWTKVEHLP